MTKRVLVAVDGTEASNTALEIACALADSYDAHLGLLCVIEPEKVTDELIEGAIVEGVLQRQNYDAWYHASVQSLGRLAVSKDDERGAYVAQLATVLADSIVAEAAAYTRDSAAKAIKTFVRSGNVAEEIIKVAQENDADLIVMGHDRQGRLESLIKSSVAEAVERNSPCPCLIYCLPNRA